MTRRLLHIVLLCLCLVSCGGKGKLLPSVSGKAGEVLVVMDKDVSEGECGRAVREVLAAECPWFPTKEALYTLVNVTPQGFADLFRIHRNIVFVDVNPDCTDPGMSVMKDVWASTQCIIKISAADEKAATAIVRENAALLTGAIEQAERDRVIANCIRYEQKELAPVVSQRFGGSPHFPCGYVLKKATDNFVWIDTETRYTTQGILIYSFPASGDPEADFARETLVGKRNAAMKENVPGMFENSYMTTSGEFPVTLESLAFRGRRFVQMRGYWEVENDFMGGPFVSHAFYGADGARVVVAEAFVYAPKFDKRQYLRQVESILYSWE